LTTSKPLRYALQAASIYSIGPVSFFLFFFFFFFCYFESHG